MILEEKYTIGLLEVLEVLYNLEKRYSYIASKREENYKEFLELSEWCGFIIYKLFDFGKDNSCDKNFDRFDCIYDIYKYYQILRNNTRYYQSSIFVSLEKTFIKTVRKVMTAEDYPSETKQALIELTKIIEE